MKVIASEASFPLSLEFLYLVGPCVRACVRASVRAFLGGFWAPFPTGFRDLGLSKGFNFGLLETRCGVVPLSGVRGRLLGSSPHRFPLIWGFRKGALAPSEALTLAGSGPWGPYLGASPERFPLVWVSGMQILVYSGSPGG